MAPEWFEEDLSTITGKVDVFSFGIVMYECLTLKMPWAKANLPFLITQVPIVSHTFTDVANRSPRATVRRCPTPYHSHGRLDSSSS